MKKTLVNPQNIDLSVLEDIALNAINANCVNALNEAAFKAALDGLYRVYGIHWDYQSEKPTTKAAATVNPDVKPLRFNELASAVKQAAREFPVNDNIDCDTPLNAAFHFNVDKALASCFLKSLTSPKPRRDKDGNFKQGTYNHTAMQLRLNQNMCFNIEDIQQTIATALTAYYYGFSLDLSDIDTPLQQTGAEYGIDYSFDGKDDIDGVILSDNCIKACFKAASNEMYKQATRHNKRIKTDDLISEALKSRELSNDNSNEDMEKIVGVSDIWDSLQSLDIIKADVYRACNRLFKATTAADVYTFFEYRLQGFKYSDIQGFMGCNEDRVKYLKRCLVKVAADMGYTRTEKSYTSKPIVTHKVVLSGKEYTVTTVKPVKAVKHAVKRGITGIENIKPVKAVKPVKWYSIDYNKKHYMVKPSLVRYPSLKKA